MTHKELVEVAYRWILKNGGCGIAFKELVSYNEEIPDAIGFSSEESVLIECKVSRSDFFADKKKKHRENGMGNWRFYMCPKGMIKKDELPEKWGLIYVDEKGKAKLEHDCRKISKRIEVTEGSLMKIYPEGFYIQKVIDYSSRFDANINAEKRLMYSALRRLFIKGHVKHIYDKKYNNRMKPVDIINMNEKL